MQSLQTKNYISHAWYESDVRSDEKNSVYMALCIKKHLDNMFVFLKNDLVDKKHTRQNKKDQYRNDKRPL